MNLVDQVCNLNQAKRLKELDIIQNSYFSWCGEEELRLMDSGKDGVKYSNRVFISTTESFNNMQEDNRCDVPSARPFAAAFTVAELGLMLANRIRLNKMNYTFRANLEKNGLWHLKYRTLSKEGKCIPLYQCQSNNEANAKANMLIYLLEKGLLTAKSLNERLSNCK